jgi:hypothetical protein
MHQSMLQFIWSGLGYLYGPLLLVSAAVALLVTLLLVFRGRGPMAAAASVLVVNVPVLIGLFGFLEGMLQGFMVIANSTTSPRPSDVAVGVSTALVTPLAGIALSAPCYLVALIGTVVRSLRSHEPPAFSD